MLSRNNDAVIGFDSCCGFLSAAAKRSFKKKRSQASAWERVYRANNVTRGSVVLAGKFAFFDQVEIDLAVGVLFDDRFFPGGFEDL